jgi:hypothetical protein
MRCVLCRDTFSSADSSGPAESCDCGANATREYARDMGPAELAYWRKKHQAFLRGEWLEPTEAECDAMLHERVNL